MTLTGAVVGDADDCLVLSGAQYGGVLDVQGCGELPDAEVIAGTGAGLSATATDSTGQSQALAASHLWVPMPRLWIDLVGRFLSWP